MISKLEAREALDFSSSVALGSGTLKKGDATRLRQALERQVQQGTSRRRKATRKALPMDLLKMGIRVLKVERAKDDNNAKD
jgi:hypothetical protein